MNLDDEKAAPKTDDETDVRNKPLPKFGAPRDYAHLSAEERQRLTEEMMAAHRGLVAESGLLVKGQTDG